MDRFNRRPFGQAFWRYSAHILHGAADVIGLAIIDVNIIKQPGRHRRVAPLLTAIGADAHTAVIGFNDSMRIFRVNPHIMMIAMAGIRHAL